MLEYIEQTSGIYDLLALCCSYILKEDKKSPIEYNMYGEEKYEEIKKTLEKSPSTTSKVNLRIELISNILEE